MNGVLLHHRIREIDPDLAERTLFVSGRRPSEDRLGYFRSAGGGFLEKPFDGAAVARAVRKLVSP